VHQLQSCNKKIQKNIWQNFHMIATKNCDTSWNIYFKQNVKWSFQVRA